GIDANVTNILFIADINGSQPPHFRIAPTTIMAPESGPPKGGMMSLYANLLGPSAESAPGTISRAPVVFKQSSETDEQPDDSAAKKQQVNAASLRFQPTKRPQFANQKPKPKPTLPKAAPPGPGQASNSAAPMKSSLADWAGTEDDDYGLPNNYEQYRHGDEKILEVREWKDRLYAHRMKRSLSRDSDSDDYDRPVNRQFAPPSSFAPPPNINNTTPPPPPSIPDDPSEEDAFTRRARMSQQQNDYSQTQPPPPTEEPPAPPPSRPLDTFQPTSATISRAPVRYTLPPPPEDIPASEADLEKVFAQEQPTENEPENELGEDAARSLRPGQKGFAERLLSKYGWTKGSGLGATGSGIVKPLQVKAEKRKKRPDSEGGGFVTPAGRGTIIGGKKKGGDDKGKFGPMSEVIILKGMLDGMDLESELHAAEGGGLMQEIGEECNEKYGSVERVYIARDVGNPIPVFVKFTSPLSALRAVNALEGRVFNGNAIQARFFELEKFEDGVYVD
ncbi:hypothetical protein N7448_001040, partial [Penicillium atrosanguineum]